jgi:serine/threonine protein kinase/tetratricopeptide (TPR) repeat protein
VAPSGPDATQVNDANVVPEAAHLDVAPLDPDARRLEISPADPNLTGLGVTATFDPDVTRPDLVGVASPPAAGPRTLATAGSAPRSYGEVATDLVGQTLGTRYQIEKLLGAGGMGAVYSAWDRELGVVVAVKTVRPEIAADPETALALEQRFKQELLLARQVTHKNIVRVHDMGEVDGIKYITMPYLAGDDLATILNRERRLPVRRVMRIARQVASGLAAAHEAGVVHRDLKPANIMIDASGDALVMDFGVALSTGGPKSLAAQGPDGQVRAVRPGGRTVAGSVVGTIQYMAPEQARAEEVDQRADIYAFGLILYDLLLGRTRASRGDSVIEELNLRMKETLPSPRSVDPGVPEALDQIITRCIQADATARYATTSELVADLDRLDDDGKPLPTTRRLTWRAAAAAAVVVALLLAATYWIAQGPSAPVAREPVSVLIADLQNNTGDPMFDRALEPVFKMALEDAGFISAHDRDGIRRNLGVRPPPVLDEKAGLEIAVREGVGVVLSGSVQRDGARYRISVKAIQAITGALLANETRRASSQEQVLRTATELAASIREALGDDRSGSAKRFAMEKLSATSLEAVREYSRGMEALSRAKFEEALQSFSSAAALDPNFGSAYGAMAIASSNLDRHQDAQKYIAQALSHLDGMTDRERYRTRGMSFLLSNDYQSCVKEYKDLVDRYSADASARNNLALCQSKLRNLPPAVEQMQAAVGILPNRALYRENLAMYASYSGDFAAAEKEARAMREPQLFGLLALAFAQLGQGQVTQAAQTYQALGTADEQGASYTASGLGDLAIYEGRFLDAVQIFTRGAAADLALNDGDRAANKFARLAYAQLNRNQTEAALAAAERALASSNTVKTRFLAARIFAEAGQTARARELAAGLAADLQPEPQAHAKIIEGTISLKAGDPRTAIQLLTEATALLDTWIGHLELGRAYLMAGAFPQADSEFERCLKRRGEALSLFLDEEPTYGFFPPVYYYQGLVREGLKSARAGESYRAYLEIRGKSTEDPLVADVRRRLANRQTND